MFPSDKLNWNLFGKYIETGQKTEFLLTKDTPYLALRARYGESLEYFEKNWPRYNGTALYMVQESQNAPSW